MALSDEFSGIKVAYLATDRELGVITEIFSGTPSADLKPDATYPGSSRLRTHGYSLRGGVGEGAACASHLERRRRPASSRRVNHL